MNLQSEVIRADDVVAAQLSALLGLPISSLSG